VSALQNAVKRKEGDHPDKELGCHLLWQKQEQDLWEQVASLGQVRGLVLHVNVTYNSKLCTFLIGMFSSRRLCRRIARRSRR
jgi:hypothetical protein